MNKEIKRGTTRDETNSNQGVGGPDDVNHDNDGINIVNIDEIEGVITLDGESNANPSPGVVRVERFSPGRNPNSTYTRPHPSQVTTRVYVGNLPWQISWQDLKDHMREAGEVKFADVFLDENLRSKGCGIVEYATHDEAIRAIETLHNTVIGDTTRKIFVREDREPNSCPPRQFLRRNHNQIPRNNRPCINPTPYIYGRQVFVGNLPYTTSWQELKDHFRKCGRVIRADTLIDQNGRPKGQGTILFEKPIESQIAIDTFNNSTFQGRKIVVREDKYA